MPMKKSRFTRLWYRLDQRTGKIEWISFLGIALISVASVVLFEKSLSDSAKDWIFGFSLTVWVSIVMYIRFRAGNYAARIKTKFSKRRLKRKRRNAGHAT